MARIALSCSTSCVPTSNRSDAMRAIADAGFKYLEAYSHETEARLHPDIVFADQVLEDLQKYGLRLSGLNISDVTVGCSVTAIKMEIQYAASLGCDNVTIRGGVFRTERDMNALVNVLRVLAPFAQSLGVTINVRNYHNNRIETFDDMQTVLGRINHPCVGLVLDIGQFYSSRISAWEAIDMFMPKTRLIYTRDQIGGRVVHFGKGEIDNVALLTKLAAMNYEGFVVVEPEAHARNFLKYIRDARVYLENVLQQGNIASF